MFKKSFLTLFILFLGFSSLNNLQASQAGLASLSLEAGVQPRAQLSGKQVDEKHKAEVTEILRLNSHRAQQGYGGLTIPFIKSEIAKATKDISKPSSFKFTRLMKQLMPMVRKEYRDNRNKLLVPREESEGLTTETNLSTLVRTLLEQRFNEINEHYSDHVKGCVKSIVNNIIAHHDTTVSRCLARSIPKFCPCDQCEAYTNYIGQLCQESADVLRKRDITIPEDISAQELEELVQQQMRKRITKTTEARLLSQLNPELLNYMSTFLVPCAKIKLDRPQPQPAAPDRGDSKRDAAQQAESKSEHNSEQQAEIITLEIAQAVQVSPDMISDIITLPKDQIVRHATISGDQTTVALVAYGLSPHYSYVPVYIYTYTIATKQLLQVYSCSHDPLAHHHVAISNDGSTISYYYVDYTITREFVGELVTINNGDITEYDSRAYHMNQRFSGIRTHVSPGGNYVALYDQPNKSIVIYQTNNATPLCSCTLPAGPTVGHCTIDDDGTVTAVTYTDKNTDKSISLYYDTLQLYTIDKHGKYESIGTPYTVSDNVRVPDQLSNKQWLAINNNGNTYAFYQCEADKKREDGEKQIVILSKKGSVQKRYVFKKDLQINTISFDAKDNIIFSIFPYGYNKKVYQLHRDGTLVDLPIQCMQQGLVGISYGNNNQCIITHLTQKPDFAQVAFLADIQRAQGIKLTKDKERKKTIALHNADTIKTLQSFNKPTQTFLTQKYGLKLPFLYNAWQWIKTWRPSTIKHSMQTGIAQIRHDFKPRNVKQLLLSLLRNPDKHSHRIDKSVKILTKGIVIYTGALVCKELINQYKFNQFMKVNSTKIAELGEAIEMLQIPKAVREKATLTKLNQILIKYGITPIAE